MPPSLFCPSRNPNWRRPVKKASKVKPPKPAPTRARLENLEKSVDILGQGMAEILNRTGAVPPSYAGERADPSPSVSSVLGSPSNRTMTIVESEAQSLANIANRLDNANHRLRMLLGQFGVGQPANPSGAPVPSEPSLQGARRQVEEKVNELFDILALTA